MKLVKQFALAALTACFVGIGAQPTRAAVILTFGQANDGATITGSALGGVTTIGGENIAVTVSQIDAAGLVTPLDAYFTLDTISTSAAAALGAHVFQNYAGSFSITSGLNASGINYLSGSFTDSVFGTGASLTLSASQPNNTVSFTSDVIVNLSSIRALSFGFADVSPLARIEDETLASFRSSVAGTLSASAPADVPEPATMTLVGFGLLGAAAAARRRR